MSTSVTKNITVTLSWVLKEGQDPSCVEQTVKKIFPQAYVKISPPSKIIKVAVKNSDDLDLLACSGILLFISAIVNVIFVAVFMI